MSEIQSNLTGITGNTLQVGYGAKLVNNNGNFEIVGADGVTYATLKISEALVTGNTIILGAGTANELSITQNSAQSGNLQIIPPATKGTTGQIPAIKAGTAAGVIELEWVNAGSNASSLKKGLVNLVFGSAATIPMITTGTATLDSIDVFIDTPFNGLAPQITIGVAGNLSKYGIATAQQLKATAGSRFTILNGKLSPGSEDIIITYLSDSSTTGAARIIPNFATPA